jgi:hypothetical protein
MIKAGMDRITEMGWKREILVLDKSLAEGKGSLAVPKAGCPSSPSRGSVGQPKAAERREVELPDKDKRARKLADAQHPVQIALMLLS